MPLAGGFRVGNALCIRSGSACFQVRHLVGKSFTVADLNVASILTWGKMARLDMSAHPEWTARRRLE
jgi:glutathione S-transferase